MQGPKCLLKLGRSIGQHSRNTLEQPHWHRQESDPLLYPITHGHTADFRPGPAGATWRVEGSVA